MHSNGNAGDSSRQPTRLPLAALLLAVFGSGLTDPLMAADPAVLASADPQRAKRLTKKCSKCHADQGISDDPEVPHLVGQRNNFV